MKEIIINGVNVVECIYFQQEDDEYTCGAEECNGAVVGCRACDNCYYKQLKRKEQENAELKRYKFLFEKAKEFKEKTDKWAEKCLKENEDLKDTIKRFVCQAECYKHKEADKYKQTLNAIKEIAEKYDAEVGDTIIVNPIQDLYDIYKKISEV